MSDDEVRQLEKKALEGDAQATEALRAAMTRAGLRFWVFVRRETAQEAQIRLTKEARSARALKDLIEARKRGAQDNEIEVLKMLVEHPMPPLRDAADLVPLPEIQAPDGGRATSVSWDRESPAPKLPENLPEQVAASMCRGDPLEIIQDLSKIMAIQPPNSGHTWLIPVASFDAAFAALKPGEDATIWDAETGVAVKAVRHEGTWRASFGEAELERRARDFQNVLMQAIEQADTWTETRG